MWLHVKLGQLLMRQLDLEEFEGKSLIGNGLQIFNK